MTPQERAAMVLEALETGRDAAYQIAKEYHESMKGYRRRSHDTLDADVAKIDAALEALRAALEAPEPSVDYSSLAAVLRGGRQCDEDGTEIIMSRQACCEAADILEQSFQEPTGVEPTGAEPAPVEPGWINVADGLPDLDVPVFGLVRGAIAVYCRTFFGEGEGWLWSIQPIYWDLTQADGFECEDDYEVEFWRPMFDLPKGTP